MNYETIIFLVTLVVQWLFGFLSKNKMKMDPNLIPYQNLIIGVVVAIIEWIITKDLKEALIISGLFAGGVYDLVHNISSMNWYKKLKNTNPK